MDTPRIYVACLSSYNAGTLHGRWIDADQDADSIREEAAAMLAESKHGPAEEWAIHDYEGFGGLRLSESEDFDTVADLAAAIARHGTAFLAYAEHVGTDHATAQGFEDCYRGEHTSPEDYAQEFVEQCYSEKELGPLASYIDWERYARDLELNGDVVFVPGGQGVYVFDGNV
jgi:antirestriction protein